MLRLWQIFSSCNLSCFHSFLHLEKVYRMNKSCFFYYDKYYDKLGFFASNGKYKCEKLLPLNMQTFLPFALICWLTLIGLREGTFYPIVLFGLNFVSLIFIKMPLSGAKDEYFSCFHSSCQWGLNRLFFYLQVYFY